MSHVPLKKETISITVNVFFDAKKTKKNPNCEAEWKHNYLNEIISQGFSLL